MNSSYCLRVKFKTLNMYLNNITTISISYVLVLLTATLPPPAINICSSHMELWMIRESTGCFMPLYFCSDSPYLEYLICFYMSGNLLIKKYLLDRYYEPSTGSAFFIFPLLLVFHLPDPLSYNSGEQMFYYFYILLMYLCWIIT